MQHDTITAAEGQQLVKLTIESIRKEDKFKSFYDRVLLHQSEFDIGASTLSRKRHAPWWLQIGLTDGNFHSTPEYSYRHIYYEALDLAVEPINSRFNQPGYKVYRNVEDLVLNACRRCPYDTELSNVCDFYKDDISKMQLQVQLPLLKALFAEEKNQSELSINEGLDDLLQKFEHIFVAVITLFPFLLCRYFYYQLVAYCVCFKMICKRSL